MKKIILLMVMLCLVGCGSNDKKESKKTTGACNDETSSACEIKESADMSAYENFTDKNNQFVKSSMSDVLSLLEKKESAIVYFGYPDCPWCVEALPVLNEVAKKENKQVLYVQIKDAEGNYSYSDEEKQKMMTYSDAFLEQDEEGNKKFYVPFVATIKDGSVVAGHVGTVDGYDIQERKMKDDEKQQLVDIYTEMFKK